MSGRWEKTRNSITVATLALSVLGCAVTSEPLTPAERELRATRDLGHLFDEQEPVNAPISFAEAVARTIKYNLEHRVALMEQAVASRRIDLASANLLPRLVASLGYTERSNQAGSSSQSLLSGEQSLEPSTSQEREQVLTDLTLAWNFLDFGVSYLTAKQTSDEYFIATEQRRKAIQNLIQEVVDAYWRAWNAQDLLQELEEIMAETEAALDKSRQLVAGGNQGKKEALVYQRSLLDIHSRLWEVRENLSQAHTRLARLMNLRPGTDYRLSGNPDFGASTALNTPLSELEARGLELRPELRQEDYQLRISRLEVRKAILRRFPGIEVSTGTHYDGNDFLFNKDWSDAGVRITWNLLGVLTGGREQRFQETRLELARTRRLDLSMAVLTQVRLAAQRYELARQRYETASNLADIDNELWHLADASRTTQTELDKIRARATALSSKMNARLAFAEKQQALARVLNSVGEDPLPARVLSHGLRPLTTAIDRHWAALVGRYVDDPPVNHNREPLEYAFAPTLDLERKLMTADSEAEPGSGLAAFAPQLVLRPKLLVRRPTRLPRRQPPTRRESDPSHETVLANAPRLHLDPVGLPATVKPTFAPARPRTGRGGWRYGRNIRHRPPLLREELAAHDAQTSLEETLAGGARP